MTELYFAITIGIIFIILIVPLYWKEKGIKHMMPVLIIALILAALIGAIVGGALDGLRGSFHRKKDDTIRVVTLFDDNGDIIAEWRGRIDFSPYHEDGYFICDDKEVYIEGGIVISEDVE